MSSGRFKLVSSESPLRGTLVRTVMFCSSPEAMFVSTPNSLSFSRRFATELSTFTRVYPRIKHGPTIEKRAKRINQVDVVQPLELPPSCIHKGKRDSVVFGKFARNLDGRGQRVSVF